MNEEVTKVADIHDPYAKFADPLPVRVGGELDTEERQVRRAECMGKLYNIQDRYTRSRMRKNKLHPGASKDPNYSKLGLKKCPRNPKRASNYPTGIDKLRARAKAVIRWVMLEKRVSMTPAECEKADQEILAARQAKNSSTENGGN